MWMCAWCGTVDNQSSILRVETKKTKLKTQFVYEHIPWIDDDMLAESNFQLECDEEKKKLSGIARLPLIFLFFYR